MDDRATLSPTCRMCISAFPKAGGGELLVLDGINLALNRASCGLLGRSVPENPPAADYFRWPSLQGETGFSGQSHPRARGGISMVFQSLRCSLADRSRKCGIGTGGGRTSGEGNRHACDSAIDLIGLNGYESAYPRELSGGMRQRVRFRAGDRRPPQHSPDGRALFGARRVDRQKLRTDFLELWSEGDLPIKGVILVTHNIEEAVSMCDRALLFSTNPGRIVTKIKIPMRQPRERQDPEFGALVDRIYVEMTARRAEKLAQGALGHIPGSGFGLILPRISVNLLSGLLEALAAPPFNGRADLPDIASDLQLEEDRRSVSRGRDPATAATRGSR